MRFNRIIPLVLALAALPVGSAQAQFGGMPGMPGPGMPGMPGMPGPSAGPQQPFGAPQQPPPACQQLLTYRDETAKHGQTLQAAGKRKAQPDELCKLFKSFLSAETKFLKGLEDNRQVCGVPAEVIAQAKAGHNKAAETAKHVCDAAAAGPPKPAAPTLSDALGTTPSVPEPSRGMGTFDTLSGSPLAR
jgi:hypothetical protein